MAEYTGPVGFSKLEWDIWYHRMKDVCHMVYQRRHALICNPADEALMRDMLERLPEDDTWPHDNIPDLYTHATVPKGSVFPFDPITEAIRTFEQINRSRRGFGRWAGLELPTKDGLTDPFKVHHDED